MLENYKSAEVTRAKEMIASIKKDIKGIDAKYKKIAELEKQALVSACAAYQTIIDFWDKFDSAPLPTEEKKTEIPSAEEQVVDTIFPDNNEEDTTEVTEDPGPEVDGAGFTDADNYPQDEENLPVFEEIPTEGASESGFDEDAEAGKPDEDEDDDDDWGKLTQEWEEK